MRALAVLLVLVPALGAPAGAAAQGSLFLRGARAYAEERYDEAATHFRDAYAADPDPTYLYHLGRALEGAGDAAGALSAYEAFLAVAPDAPERDEVDAWVELLRLELGVAAPAAPVAEPEPPEPPPDASARRAAPPSLVRPSRGRSPSPWPWVVLAGGALVFVAGAVTAGVAVESHGAADRAPSHAETVAREAEAQSQATAATVLLVLGGAVALGGGAWGVVDLVAPSGEAAGGDAEARLRVVPGGVVLDGAF